MAAEDAPITVKEVLRLPKFGVDRNFFTFTHVTMESDKYICVRETYPRNSLLMIDVNNPTATIRRPITADSALMNPDTRILALKAQLPGTTQDHLEIFNMDLKARIKTCSISEQVNFWKWITPKMLGLVTRTSVYHWSIEDNWSLPVKIFDRLAHLSNSQIINYCCDPSEKWLVLIGIAPGAPERPHLVKGNMQLFSVDQQLSRALEGHAASFASFKVGGNENSSTLICFASRTAYAGHTTTTSSLYVTELVAQTGKPSFANKLANLSFPLHSADDFPVGMQISQKYSLIYVITKYGHLFVHDLETATAVYGNWISKTPIFLTTAASRIGGIFAINRTGEVIQATVNEATIVPFVRGQLENLGLADNLAKRLAQVKDSDASQISNFRDEWSSLEVLYSDILDATNGFSDSSKIGVGGYGSVYKGTLGSGIVAIKMLDSKSKQGRKEFIQELEVLYQMWHPNLVKLVGACFEVHALVYEYLPNGSLEDCLRDSPSVLTWQMRTHIMYEICSSLIYLHSRSVVHGDLKPANILLDANYKSKLSDFGLCRFLPQEMTTAVYLETVPKGTSGYIDPWFLENCILRPGSDLYSFGITILKLLTRMPPVGLGWKALGSDENSFREMIDPTAGSWPFEFAKELLYWSLQCCYHNEKSSELLEDMSTCLEDMLAEIETLQEGRSKVMARRKKAAEDSLRVEEKKEPVVIMVLEINIHSVAYAQEIKERILRMKGVHDVKLVPKASEVSVKGAFDPLKLIEYVKRMTGKHVAIVRVERLAEKPQIEKEKIEKTDGEMAEGEKSEKEVDKLPEEVEELSLEEGFTSDAKEELSEEKGLSDKIL